MSERNPKMTYVEIMQLLTAYRRNECLWNHAHSNYRNQAVRNESFTNISIEMDIISIEEVKRRIKILRDTYNIEKNKMRKSRLAGARPGGYYTTKIPWFKAADDFLSKCDGKQSNPNTDSDAPCKSEQSSQQSDRVSSPELEQQDSPDPLWQYGEVLVGTNESQSSCSSAGRKHLFESTPSTIPTPMKKVYRPASQSAYANGNSWGTERRSSHAEVIQSKRANVTSSVADPIQDEFLYFGLNLAAQLGELPKLRALMLQEKIQTLVSQERIEFEMSQQGLADGDTVNGHQQ